MNVLDSWMVFEFPNGQRAAQRVWNVVDPNELEDKWQDAWNQYGQTKGECVRVGLAFGSHGDDVSSLAVSWLGYRDAVMPPPDLDDLDDEIAAFEDGKLKSHPAADILPMLDDAELQALAADIKANGQTDPIILFDGQVLDGRNRLRACAIAGVEPRFVDGYDGASDPETFVLSKNLHRRHLSESQRALVAARVCKNSDKSSRDAGKLLNISHTSVCAAVKVLEQGDAETIAKVERGEITVNRALSPKPAVAVAEKEPDDARSSESRILSSLLHTLGVVSREWPTEPQRLIAELRRYADKLERRLGRGDA